MPSDLGLHAIQEGLTQSGYGGVLPFLHHAVYLDYATDKTYFGPLTA